MHLCAELIAACWNLLEKLALIFLYNFHCEHSEIRSIIEKLSSKINVKNIKNPVKWFYQFKHGVISLPDPMSFDVTLFNVVLSL